MATKCPRCGSKNTECINRVEQVVEIGLKFTAAAVCSIAGTALGQPNAGKWVASKLAGPPKDSIYKCKSCGKTFKP